MAAQSGGGGGGVSAAAIRAGEAFVEFTIKDNTFRRGLANLKTAVTSTWAGIQKAGTLALGAGTAGLGAFGGALKLAVDRGAALDTLAQRLGTTTEALGELGHAGSTVGVPLEEVADIAKDLQEKLSEAAKGEGAAEFMKELGLDAQHLLTLDLPGQFGAIGDALAGVANPADRTRIAMGLMSDGGSKLLPVLTQGSAGFAKLAEEARAAGAVMDGETAARARSASKTLTLAWTAVENAAVNVGAALLPTGEEIGRYTGQLVAGAKQVHDWIGANQDTIRTAALVAAGLAAGGGAVVALGLGFSTAATAAGGFVAVLGAVKAAALAVVSPVGLVVAAAAGLGYLFVTQTEMGGRWRDNVVGYFGEVAANAKTAFGGVTDALRAGDFALAGKVALAALNVEWKRGLLALQDAWNGFKGFFVDGWHDAVLLVELALVDLLDNFKGSIGRAIQSFDTAFKKLPPWLQGAVDPLGLLDTAALVASTKADDVKDVLLDDARRDQRVRDEFRNAERAARQAALDAAQADLQHLRLTAAFRALFKGGPGEPGPAAGPGGGPAPAPLPPQVTAVRGAFSGRDIARQLGGNADPLLAVARKQLTVEEEARDQLKRMADRIDRLDNLRWAL